VVSQNAGVLTWLCVVPQVLFCSAALLGRAKGRRQASQLAQPTAPGSPTAGSSTGARASAAAVPPASSHTSKAASKADRTRSTPSKQPPDQKPPSRPTAAVQQLDRQYAPMWAVQARPWLVAASTIAPQAALLLGQLLLPPPPALLPLSVAYAHSSASGSHLYWGYGLLALMMPVVSGVVCAGDMQCMQGLPTA
jgi:hypothetical protein